MMSRNRIRASRLSMIMYAVVFAGSTACDGSSDPTSPMSLRLVALTPTTISGVVGSWVELAPTVRVTDERGRPVAGERVTFEMASGEGSIVGPTAVSDAEGVVRPSAWTLGTVVGTSVLRARLSASPSTTVDFTATTRAGIPSTIVALSGDRQRGPIGEMLPEPLFIKVMDAYANPLAGVEVTFSVLSGDGIVGGAATTNANGVASPGRWTLGNEPIEQRILARIGSVRVEFSAFGYGPCVSPCTTGRPLAFVRDGDIYVANFDGTGLIQLTTGNRSSEPAWSPDGRRIAFSSWGMENSNDIYLIDADGFNLRRYASEASSPAWSPDGRQIAYSGWHAGHWNILVAPVEADGTPTIAVGFSPGTNSYPAWSPDGRRIAFVSDWTAYDLAMEVYIVNADGSGRKQVTNGYYGNIKSWPYFTIHAQPAWSPDGTQLAIVACEDLQDFSCNESSVAIVATDGSGIRTIATTSGLARPAWIPGGLIAFSRICLENPCAPTLLATPSDGGIERLLLANAHSGVWRP